MGKKGLVLSCIVASLVLSSGYADTSSYVVDDLNTTGVVLEGDETLTITSTGSIEVSSERSSVGAVESNTTGNISNFGTININSTDANVSDYAGGIMQRVDGNTIINSGTIDSNSTEGAWAIGIAQLFDYEIDINGLTSGSEELNVTALTKGEILNQGDIKTNSKDTSMGIIEVYGDVENSGTITAATLSGSSYMEDVAVGVWNLHGSVVNAGTITADASDYGVSVGLDAWDGNISNSGTISVSSGSYLAVGVFSSSYGNRTISNSGTISAKSTEGYGFGIWTQYGFSDIINTGTITADTAIFVDSSEGASSTISNSGFIDTYNIYADSSELTNSGTIYLHNSLATMSEASATPRIRQISSVNVKTFNQTASGVLKIDALLENDGSEVAVTNPTVYARESANIEDGSTIDVNVISASDTLTQAFLDSNGTIDNVVVSDDMNVSVDKLNITDNSPILDFEAFMSSETALSLKAVEVATLNPQDTPLVAVSTPSLGMQTLNMLNTVVQARQDNMRGLGSGDIAFRDKHIWFKPFGMYTKQDDKDGINGFDANTYGFGIGADGEYQNGRRVGLALFYSNTNLDINNIAQSDDLNSFTLVAYGSNPIIDDKTMFFYQVGFGAQKNSSKRYVTATAQTAKADYTSRSFYMQAKATRDYSINDKLTVTPALKAALRYFQSPSYSESGAGAYNLTVNSSRTTQAILGLMANLKYKINTTTKIISNVALDYDLNNNAQSVNAYFQGTPGVIFNTTGIKNSALGYEFGLGLSKELKRDLTLDFKYNLNGKGSDFLNHSITAKFKWRF